MIESLGVPHPEVDKQSIIEQVGCLRRQATHIEQFQRCQDCVVYRRRYRIYWKGSHYERLQQFIDEVLDSITGK
ncbi:hypothetical protein ANSO36C_26980 [Nostoc cf. commune SO-36]|uniref:Mut7-C RNAse domain-containing protein n=2 Tax=Nostoc commune TaxID=1178 RepID=A0ABN6Q0U2_NOSCO|nr:hypothetical protein ANSO36C_26980 [Nostoc cf. commune SO-36]